MLHVLLIFVFIFVLQFFVAVHKTNDMKVNLQTEIALTSSASIIGGMN